MVAASNVFQFIRSIGDNGTSANFLIVKVPPLAVTCVLRVICILEPSGMVASIIGSATEICFPLRCASLIMKESSSFSLNTTLVEILVYCLWYRYTGVSCPLQETSSILSSSCMASIYPNPTKSRFTKYNIFSIIIGVRSIL